MRWLWRAAYAPGDGQTSPAYSSNPVQHLYISCYVIANKLVLSYLLLRLLQHDHGLHGPGPHRCYCTTPGTWPGSSAPQRGRSSTWPLWCGEYLSPLSIKNCWNCQAQRADRTRKKQLRSSSCMTVVCIWRRSMKEPRTCWWRSGCGGQSWYDGPDQLARPSDPCSKCGKETVLPPLARCWLHHAAHSLTTWKTPGRGDTCSCWTHPLLAGRIICMKCFSWTTHPSSGFYGQKKYLVQARQGRAAHGRHREAATAEEVIVDVTV